MTNQPDPLDNLPAGDGTPREGLPPAPEPVEFDFPLVSERSREDLGAYGINIVDDYHDFKKEVLSWLATYGKHPEKGQGLAETTLQSTHHKLEIVFRWLWEDEDAYTTEFTPDHADRFIRLLNLSELSDSARFTDHSPSGDRVATGAEADDRCPPAFDLPAPQKEKHLKAGLNPSSSLGPNLGTWPVDLFLNLEKIIPGGKQITKVACCVFLPLKAENHHSQMV